MGQLALVLALVWIAMGCSRSGVEPSKRFAYKTDPGEQRVSVEYPLPENPGFAAPVRLMADGKPVRVEPPGFAAPCWADLDGDGDKDLLVGQFREGRIQVCDNLGDGKLAASQWLQAGGKVAQVPGVW